MRSKSCIPRGLEVLIIIGALRSKEESKKGRMEDALALRGEEGRDKLR
jgi:hypothetical protein